MSLDTIDHPTLARLVEAGAVRGAHVIGQEGGWSVMIKYGMAERALAAQRSRQVRVFKRIDTAASYLKDIGIAHFDVDTAAYAPEAIKKHARPDRAAALRRAHEAAQHDAWFRGEVQKTLDRIADSTTRFTPHDVVMQRLDARIARLKAKDEGT
jgi:hypothetical protein